MMQYEFDKAVAEGKRFWMRQYKMFGEYTTGHEVDAETALRKSKVRVGVWCPYSFSVVED